MAFLAGQTKEEDKEQIEKCKKEQIDQPLGYSEVRTIIDSIRVKSKMTNHDERKHRIGEPIWILSNDLPEWSTSLGRSIKS